MFGQISKMEKQTDKRDEEHEWTDDRLRAKQYGGFGAGRMA